MEKITIFTVGGTIDKIYSGAVSEYKIGSPTIERFLQTYQVYFDYEIKTLMRKDSLDMTDADRQTVHDAITKCSDTHILITHGTDTMEETAKALGDIDNKTIVLTGSLLHPNMNESDAEFNIGTALGALWAAKPGTYIAMNGFVFPWDNVRKDRSEGRFIKRK